MAAVSEFALLLLAALGVLAWVLAGLDGALVLGLDGALVLDLDGVLPVGLVGVLSVGLVGPSLRPEQDGGARVGVGVHADGPGRSQLVLALAWPATPATATAWPGTAING